jgi:hypothetical protein
MDVVIALLRQVCFCSTLTTVTLGGTVTTQQFDIAIAAIKNASRDFHNLEPTELSAQIGGLLVLGGVVCAVVVFIVWSALRAVSSSLDSCLAVRISYCGTASGSQIWSTKLLTLSKQVSKHH